MWHLRQSSDIDATANANNGTAGANSSTNGVVGYGQYFPEWQAGCTFVNKSCWEGLQALSVECWQKTWCQGAGILRYPGEGFYVWSANDNSLAITVGGVWRELYSAGGCFPDSVWHLFGGTWQSGDVMRVYKDGVLNHTGGESFAGTIDDNPAYDFQMAGNFGRGAIFWGAAWTK